MAGFPRARPATVAAALLVSTVLVGGAVAAFVHASDDSGPATTTGHPLATVASTPSASPTPEVTSTPTPEPTASATPSAIPSATSATPRPSSSSVPRYPYPSNPRTASGLTFSAVSQAQGSSSEVVLTISAKDGDGDITFGGLTWGDGNAIGPDVVPDHCPAYPSPTSRPGAYQSHGDSRSFTYRHTYSGRDTYKITMTVKSGNNECRPNGPAAQSESASLLTSFTAANANATATATASPMPSSAV